MSLAPTAVFCELYFSLNFFLIFARVIIIALALSALQLYQIWLRHLPIKAYSPINFQSPERELNSRLILTMDPFCH